MMMVQQLGLDADERSVQYVNYNLREADVYPPLVRSNLFTPRRVDALKLDDP